jgi:hypothetical protein
MFSISFLHRGRGMNTRMLYGLVLGVVVGVALGVGVYTFAYAKGWSYLARYEHVIASSRDLQLEYDAKGAITGHMGR